MTEADAVGAPVTVTVEDARERAGPKVDTERWRHLACAALHSEGAHGELTLTFVDDTDIAELNLEHMGNDGPTDVLSFPMDDEPPQGVPRLLGDVVIAPSVAAAQYADHAGTYDDEIALLVVHGVLHVLGHDHADRSDAALMRDRERGLLVEHHWHGDPPPAFRHTHLT